MNATPAADPEQQRLEGDLLRCIRHGAHAPLADDAFAALARRVFRFQYTRNAVYRAFCDRRGATPDTVAARTDVPAVPTDAFKAAPLISGPVAAVTATFRTSGTTAGAERRGEHHFPDLTLYDAALRAGFRAHLLPDHSRLRIFALVPLPADAPDSSLSHMIGAVIADYGTSESDSYVRRGAIDVPRLIDALAAAERDAHPVGLLGTSFALVHLIDALAAANRRFRLPPGSRIMDTGGFKGRSRTVERDELYTALEHGLGVSPEWCVNEYGMTEMSSQFYDAIAGHGAPLTARLHHGPAWVRTQAVDPESLELLPDGEAGILRHWDLANLHSVAVLQTSDMGICSAEGFRLLGRAPGAEPRGCSLATEELIEAMRRLG